MRLETARDQFIADKRSEGKSVHTLRSYHGRLNSFIEWVIGNTQKSSVLQFKADVVRSYLDHRSSARNLSMHTLNLDSTALREFAAWGAKKRYWRRDDVEDIPAIDKPKTLPRPFANDELEALMQLPLADKADDVLRGLLYYTGLRSSEATGVRLRDIRPPHIVDGETVKKGELMIWGKGSKERAVPIPPPLWRLLLGYLETIKGARSDRTLLAQADGSRWSSKMVQRRMRAWGKTVGIDKPRAHRMRHSYASEVYEKTSDIYVVKDLLGHASVATTQIYTHLDMEKKSKAVDVLRDFTPTPEVRA